MRRRRTARCNCSSDCSKPAALIRSSSSNTSATSLSGPIESSRPRGSSESRTSLQSRTHRSQMKTPGPATSLRTLSLLLPQNEQRPSHGWRLPASLCSLRLNTIYVQGYPDVCPASRSPDARCPRPTVVLLRTRARARIPQSGSWFATDGTLSPPFTRNDRPALATPRFSSAGLR